MDPALVSALFAGVGGLVAAVGTALSARQRSVARDVSALDTEVALLRARQETAMAHIHELRMALAAAGVPVPDLPRELRAPTGRHHQPTQQ